MKKYFLGIFAFVTATLLFSFSTGEYKKTASSERKFAQQIYEFTPMAGVPNPPTTKGQVTNILNWTQRTAAPPCNGLGNKFCRIEFDNTNTTLAQALDIIGNRIQNGQPITHNTTYIVSGKTVTIFLKS